MKIGKLKEMIDLIDAVQCKDGKNHGKYASSVDLAIDICPSNAIVSASYMWPEVAAALVNAGFSLQVNAKGASISLKSED